MNTFQPTSSSSLLAALVREARMRSPLIGKEKIRQWLSVTHGMHVSSSTIGRIIERDCLYFAATPLHWKKRTQCHPDLAEGRHDVMVRRAHHDTWKWLLRSALFTSVLVNIAVLMTALLTSLFEVEHPAGTLNASTTEIHTLTSASLEP
jgi:hypothetical protein